MSTSQKNLLLNTYIFAGLSLFSSCSTITATLIAPDIQTPSITQAETIDLNFSIIPGRGATLFDDASDRPPTYSTDFASIDNRGGALTAGLGYGLARSIAISGGLLGSDSLVDGFWASGKIQLVGPQGMLSTPLHITTYGRIGATTGSRSGDHDGEFGPGGFPWEATRSGNFINAGFSVGYPITPIIMPFIGYGIGRASIEAEVKQTAAGSDPGGVFKQSFKGKMTTWGGGIQFFEEKFRLSVGAQRTKTEVGIYSVQESLVSLSLEFRVRDNRKSESPTINEQNASTHTRAPDPSTRVSSR